MTGVRWIFANNQPAIAIVDEVDFAYLSQFNWTINPRGHFVRNDRGTTLMMHRVIAERAGLDMSRMIDHKNRLKSDNRRENLRPASNSQNQHNVGKSITNTSGYKGVTFDTKSGKWLSRIRDGNGQRQHLGSFDSKEQAAEAYRKAAIKFHMEFMCLE